jgi:hypothetical protein
MCMGGSAHRPTPPPRGPPRPPHPIWAMGGTWAAGGALRSRQAGDGDCGEADSRGRGGPLESPSAARPGRGPPRPGAGLAVRPRETGVDSHENRPAPPAGDPAPARPGPARGLSARVAARGRAHGGPERLRVSAHASRRGGPRPVGHGPAAAQRRHRDRGRGPPRGFRSPPWCGERRAPPQAPPARVARASPRLARPRPPGCDPRRRPARGPHRAAGQSEGGGGTRTCRARQPLAAPGPPPPGRAVG